MKYAAILFIIVLLACNEHKQEQHFSKTQLTLFRILDNYKIEYANALVDSSKEKIRYKYLKNLYEFVVDTMGRYLDSIKVTVDTVMQEGWNVTTQFHTKEIVFKYSQLYKDSMPASVDSEYHSVIRLRPGEELTADFVNLGTAEINPPGEKNVSTIRIFALPILATFGEKNKNRNKMIS